MTLNSGKSDGRVDAETTTEISAAAQHPSPYNDVILTSSTDAYQKGRPCWDDAQLKMCGVSVSVKTAVI